MYPRTEMSRWLRSFLCANYWNHLYCLSKDFQMTCSCLKIFSNNLESRMSSVLSSKWHAKFWELKTVSRISVQIQTFMKTDKSQNIPDFQRDFTEILETVLSSQNFACHFDDNTEDIRYHAEIIVSIKSIKQTVQFF
jgi:hypothetical protein